MSEKHDGVGRSSQKKLFDLLWGNDISVKMAIKIMFQELLGNDIGGRAAHEAAKELNEKKQRREA